MRALDGLKVVDFSWNITGPTTVRYLADHGATVVRIESPEHPDNVRFKRPYKDEVVGVNRSGYFVNYNINKYGVTFDLKNVRGLELAKRLIGWADILVESFRPGVMKRWGLDYDSAKRLNPSLIYASTSQLGQTGPHRDYAGFGIQAAAIAGFDYVTGWYDRMPSGVFESYTDSIAPRFLIAAIMVALLQRRETGEGQYIEQAQLEAAVHFLAPALLDYSVNKRVKMRDGNRDPYAAPNGAYRCAGEDRWCVISVSTDEEWQSFCKVMGKSMLITDERFATLKLRKENEDELDRLVEEWTSKLSAEKVMNLLQKAGVAAGVVEKAQEMHNDIQLQHRKHYVVLDHPVIGQCTVDALPFRLSATPAEHRLPAPCLGQHNAYVCIELLNLRGDEFAKMAEAGAFG